MKEKDRRDSGYFSGDMAVDDSNSSGAVSKHAIRFTVGGSSVDIFQEDAERWLSMMDAGSVDVCITDPPYWTLDQDELWDIFVQLDRVLAPSGHLYMFCDDEVSSILLNWIREDKDMAYEGAHLLTWDKMNRGMGYHYAHQTEHILFAWRRKRRPLRTNPVDILRCKMIRGGYPTEKPAALVTTLITESLRVGETLIDPFAGSGVVGAAVPFDYKARVLLNDSSDAAQEHMMKRFSQLDIF